MVRRTRLVSASEIATELGITKSMVHRLAIRRGLGVMVGNQRLFTPAEMDNLRVRQRGRPRVRPGKQPT